MAENAKTPTAPKKHAPMLYLISGIKIFKGLVLLFTALGIFALAGKDLEDLFDQLLRWMHLDPENRFFGNIGDWLAIAGWAQRAVDARLAAATESPPLEREAYLRLVVDENVRLQLTHLSHLSVVREQRMRTPGVPRLHGWVYDIGTGLVKVVGASDT